MTVIAFLVLGCAERDFDEDGVPDDEEEALGLNPLDADSDDDGLSDAAELEIGSDPLDADTDDDGLDDLTEYRIGTAFDQPDTDGDGYTDRDEDFEGRDPLDPLSVIYQGGWPYYFEKTELRGGLEFEVGNRFANLELEDQFGDVVSLWDFYNEEKFVLVEVCAGWYPTCKSIAKWLTGGDPDGWDFEPYASVRDAVQSGDLTWITVLGEAIDGPGEIATAADVTRWADSFPNPGLPVLLDSEHESYEFVGLTYYPTMVLLAPDLKVYAIGDSGTGYGPVLDAALEVVQQR